MPRVHNVASLLKRWLLGTLRAVFNNSISITTSMKSRFASTAAAQTQEDCSFTASPNKLSPSVRRPTVPLFSADVL
jgi:hypothetical protein